MKVASDMGSDRILDSLVHIPWSTLEHAYGDAGDIPNIFRGLVSHDPDQREWAHEMLDMGPFHQGSLYSCTPFVIRVLLQIAQEKDVADLPWIFQYVSQVLAAATMFLSAPETTEKDPERAIAADILVEVRSQLPVLLSMFEHPDSAVCLALLRLLVLLRTDLPELESALAERFKTEADESMRAALAFCLNLAGDEALQSTAERILEQTTESPLAQIAVGFGSIAAMKELVGDRVVTAFCHILANNFAALDRFEDIYADYLTPLGAPPNSDRLVDCLQQEWSSHQREQIIQALLSVYAQLPMASSGGIRIGYAYYLEAMVRLAFPDGELSPETTIRDLNDIQRRILEAFQQYDMPSITWNDYYPSDYRDLLGFDFRSETDFLDFMSGNRTAHHTKP